MRRCAPAQAGWDSITRILQDQHRPFLSVLHVGDDVGPHVHLVTSSMVERELLSSAWWVSTGSQVTAWDWVKSPRRLVAYLFWCELCQRVDCACKPAACLPSL